MYAGCQVFPTTDYYNRVVTAAPVDPNSAAYIKATVDAGDTGGLNMWTPTAEYLNVATASTPLVPTRSTADPLPASIPWLSSFRIESVSDAHAFVLDTSHCILYETYNTSYSGGVLSAYSGGEWSLSQPMMQPIAGQGPTAAAIPMWPGLVRPEEIAAGVIAHALYFNAIYGTLSATVGMPPAPLSGDAVPYKGPASEASTALPLGARLRLRADYPVSSLAPQAQIVARALQTYGAIVADTGCCDAVEYALSATYGAPDPFSASDLATLNQIKITDFSVVDSP
ncbi:MAG: hypothetical protein KGM44_12300 [bacterium]|nr:hypothetical protein [bacterium]